MNDHDNASYINRDNSCQFTCKGNKVTNQELSIFIEVI